MRESETKATDRGRLRRNALAAIVTVFALTAVGTALAGSVFLTQTIPGASQPTGMTGCSTLAQIGNSTSNGTLGNFSAAFGCSSPVGPAIHVSSQASNKAAFTTPTNVTGVYLMTSSSTIGATGCQGVSGALKLKAGASITVPLGSYDYCVDAAGTYGSFTISWS